MFSLTAIAVAFTVFISSCNKDAPDLTSRLVGTYNGAFVDISGGNNYDSTGESIIITKVDNQTVQISPVQNAIIPFTATVTVAANGYTISIPQQTYNGASVTGNPNYNSDPTVNGAYLTSGSTFASSIVIVSNGTTIIQTYTGTKQ